MVVLLFVTAIDAYGLNFIIMYVSQPPKLSVQAHGVIMVGRKNVWDLGERNFRGGREIRG